MNLSIYSNGIVDITGKYFNVYQTTSYTYTVHWSWIYLLDNDCKNNNVSLFSWLGNQKNNKNSNDENQENNDDNSKCNKNNYIKINFWIILLIILS